MTDAQLTAAREAALRTLSGLIDSGSAVLQRLEELCAEIMADEDSAQAVFQRLERASPGFGRGDLANYYTKDRTPANVPLFSFNGTMHSCFGPLPAEEEAELRQRFVVPAADAVNSIAGDAHRVFIAMAGRVSLLRRLTGFEDTLEALGEALAPPWVVHPSAQQLFSGINGDTMLRLHQSHLWNLPKRAPIHRILLSDRQANVQTLELLRLKTRRALAILEGARDEVPFATLRPEPFSMPQSLLQISNVAGNVQVGNGNTVSISNPDLSELIKALSSLRNAAEDDPEGITAAALARTAEDEVRANGLTTRATKLLLGISTAIQTTAALQPAYNALKAVANAHGANLP